MDRGRFITFEGGEGAGKSTQVARLVDRCRGLGFELVATREPGGTTGAEALRNLLVRGSVDRWSPLSETLLLSAARADHLERLIRPALARGAWVICDRFADSTRAYQGAGGGTDRALIDALDAAVVGAERPDVTLIMDLDPAVGLARAEARRGEDSRFELKTPDFHARVRAGFHAIAAAEPGRCVLIDAEPSADVVAEAVWSSLLARLGLDDPA